MENQIKAGQDIGKAITTAIFPSEEEYDQERAYLDAQQEAMRQVPVCPQCAGNDIDSADCDVKNNEQGFSCGDCGHTGYFDEFYR